MASSLIGTFEGTVLADDFGVGDPTEDFPTPFAWGTLAGLGWGARFSAPSTVFPREVRDTLEGGSDVPVSVRGRVEARTKRGDADFSLKLTHVEVAGGSSRNGSGSGSKAASSASA